MDTGVIHTSDAKVVLDSEPNSTNNPFIEDDNLIFTNDENLGLEDEATAVVTVVGTADNVTIKNFRSGIIDVGVGNSGDGISVEVGSESEDARFRNIKISNYDTIAGRGIGSEVVSAFPTV